MSIIIVSDYLEKKEVERLQREADKLAGSAYYSNDAIKHYFALYEKVSVSIIPVRDDILVMNCKPLAS